MQEMILHLILSGINNYMKEDIEAREKKLIQIETKKENDYNE